MAPDAAAAAAVVKYGTFDNSACRPRRPGVYDKIGTHRNCDRHGDIGPDTNTGTDGNAHADSSCDKTNIIP